MGVVVVVVVVVVVCDSGQKRQKGKKQMGAINQPYYWPVLYIKPATYRTKTDPSCKPSTAGMRISPTEAVDPELISIIMIQDQLPGSSQRVIGTDAERRHCN
jgi:hypothetical protein